jgi:uncharacterized membrane protein
VVEQIDYHAALTFLLSFECDHFASVAVAAAADIVVAELASEAVEIAAELASEAVEIAAVSGSASVDTDLELVEHFDTMVEP